MPHPTYEDIRARIELVHNWLLDTTADLSAAQLGRRPGPTAPPVGWHLWHIARFADMLQASFEDEDGMPGEQIWAAEDLVAAWDLDAGTLGVLEAGMGMDHNRAAQLPVAIGRERLLDYAREAFAALDTQIGRLEPADFTAGRISFRAFATEAGRIIPAEPAQTTTVADLLSHLVHAGRHLGMIEALRGVLGTEGTATA